MRVVFVRVEKVSRACAMCRPRKPAPPMMATWERLVSSRAGMLLVQSIVVTVGCGVLVGLLMTDVIGGFLEGFCGSVDIWSIFKPFQDVSRLPLKSIEGFWLSGIMKGSLAGVEGL